MLTTFAGTGTAGVTGDEGPAVAAQLQGPMAATAAPDGTVVVADKFGYRLRRIGNDGVIHHLAGTGGCCTLAEGVLAAGATLANIGQIALGPDGALYVAEMLTPAGRLRKITPTPMAGVALGELMIPSEDGREAYVFSGLGRHLRTVETRTGATLLTMQYANDGVLTAIQDAEGDVVSISRDAAGHPSTITGPFGQTTTLTVNADGYLETVTNPANEDVTLSYGNGGLLGGMTDALGRAHDYGYDGMGRLVLDTDPAGGSKTLTPSSVPGGRSIIVTTALGRSTTYAVEHPGTATPTRAITLPSGLAGTAHPGPAGAVTTTLPDGRVMSWSPGADPRFGMLVPFRTAETLTTPGGRTWSVTRSRTASLLDPADVLSFASLQESTTINGKTFLDIFTKSTRTLTRTTPEGRQITATLDIQGRVVQLALPGVLPVVFSHDAHGRLEAITQGSRTVTRTYRPDGFLESITDPLDQVATYTPDAIGRVVEVLRPDGEAIVYAHDAVGNLTSVMPPGRPAHGLGYSPVDQRSLYDPPALAGGPTPTIWDRDVDRKLTTVTRPGGITMTYIPDPAGRLKSMTFPGGQVTRTYDPETGKLTGLSGPAGVTLGFGHDGHLLTDVSWSGAITGTVHKGYNNDLRVLTETVDGGHALSFEYDDDGLLTSAGPLTLLRDPQNGQVAELTVGSVVETLTPSSFGEVDDRLVSVGGSTLFEVSIVQRDALGRIQEKTETIAGETYTYGYVYDLAGRLSDVYRDGTLVAHYDHDANGNRTGLTTLGSMLIGAPDDQDRLLTYGPLSFTYQDSGELQSRTDTTTGETTLYSYDPLGNLRQVTLPGGTVVDYEVDGLGRRVGKRVNGALVKAWLYSDTLRPAAELDGSGSVVARFVYGERVNVPEAMIKAGATYRLVTDPLGSVRLVVDAATRAIAQRIDYDEFGGVLLDTNPGFQPFGFAGGLYDPDTRLVRFGARDYDAETGRWTAKDPLLFGGGDTNLYAYALGDPANRVDFSGRSSDALEWFFTGALAAEAPLVVPALASRGIVGLCILMALTLESDMASEDSPDVKRCLKLQEFCLQDPWQPSWNRKQYGKRKDCGACFRQCKDKGEWPFEKCPLPKDYN